MARIYAKPASVRGHRENNLAQINSLVVDIDFADAQERNAREQEVLVRSRLPTYSFPR
ncbi:hypothetical protein [Levilactobacillus brevis]|uniref:hypothetical protein n=1 Tax=Levilactobacillus brevis TaxID=1580 RepID=UPI0025A5080A|nr:hypothetical protein [Levilactobacillus brevis]